MIKQIFMASAVALLVLGTLTGVSSAARSGGTFNFVVPYGGDVLTLDPHRTPNTNDWIVTINIHRSLYNWDDEKNRPKLELGEKVEISPDGLVYRIALKKGVKFHNGGR
jgi:peptide/nickel transport system substrate-binding protein